MPKVCPLGSSDMKKASTARKRAESEFRDKTDIQKKMDALQILCGCKSQAQFAMEIDMSLRRLRYIRQNPETITLKEGIMIQALANQYETNVFSISV